MLMYDGDSLQYMTSDLEECREVDYYIKVKTVTNNSYLYMRFLDYSHIDNKKT